MATDQKTIEMLSRDYPYGAAVSLGLMVLTLIGVMLYRRAETGGGERF